MRHLFDESSAIGLFERVGIDENGETLYHMGLTLRREQIGFASLTVSRILIDAQASSNPILRIA